MVILRIFASLSLILCLAACSTTPPSPDATYYLVRHAEKVLDVKDPPLTEEGIKRAGDLKDRLEGVSLSAIYSSDYVRTLETAKPTAEAQNITVKLYNPRELENFAAQLLKQSGTILVVGHSNTTPPLAELLGAEPGTPIVEKSEYDRLYVITRTGADISGKIETYGD